MIKRLSIRNYVLIDQLDLDFDPGLTIVTGETGAGKSILLGALGLILGERAESGVLADEDQKAVIEGIFAIREYGLQPFFTAHDLEYNDELILRREIMPHGRSRAFINDSPASLQILRELGRKLIDVHQQFDQLDVLEDDFQISMLDALADQSPMVVDYTRKFKIWKQDLDRLEKMRVEEATSEQERSFLQFQVDELLAAGLLPGESESLEEEAKTLRHATEIRQVLDGAHSLIQDADGSPADQLDALIRSLHPLRSYHAGVALLADRLESVRIELEDLAGEMESLAEKIEADPARLVEVENRLNAINKLLLKHHVTDSGTLLERLNGLEDQLQNLDGRQAEIDALHKSVQKEETDLKEMAAILSLARHEVAGTFASNMMQRLADLGMGSMRMAFQVEETEILKWNGTDKITFMMAQQEGARMAPVRQAASGGELSRLTLVIKSLVAAAIPLPSLVFDEIDAGVSGAVSMKMGDLLTRMAKEHQLIVITHSPQIASRANCHYYVSKAPENGEVRTHVTVLQGEDRIKAIAVMLSTDPPSSSALANARELVASE
ncbi:MAG: DNA repair protein RecN [Saprospiraceae bacterium]|nr:DNA repair protein RecN [Saprospiraceae bacterium]